MHDRRKNEPGALGMACLIWLLSGAGYAVSATGDVVEVVEQGTVNWTTGTGTAVAEGAPPDFATPKTAWALAEHSAWRSAQAALQNLLLNLPESGEARLDDKVSRDKSLKLLMRDLVLKAKEGTVRRLPEGHVIATLSAAFRGRFGQRRAGKDEGWLDDGPNQEGRAAGVIVDVRGVGVHPAINPRLIPEDGTRAVVMRDAVYVRGLPAAQSRFPAGAVPNRVKVLRDEGPLHADLVVGHAETVMIRQSRPILWVIVVD